MEEAIEASERIYNEIGDDDVEIIWGTTMDDSIGDEMRITVIATGIGEPEMKVKRPHVSRKAVSEFQDVTRGVVRDYTDEDREYESRLDQPDVLQGEKAAKAEKEEATRNQLHAMKKVSNGYTMIILDMDVLDVPTFLRRKAD
jgi:cell division protein FtsZ